MSDPLDARLASVRDAAQAARSIGLVVEADAADAVVERVAERAGFGGGAYVMALAGGTGVGKSSLLNALAGQAVSTVRAVRPTTDEPLAWVAEARREEVAPLLGWLGVRHVVGHADPELGSVVILDLPDVDSVRVEHRQLVDELLPRIDAVTWVADPEKYDDERLHGYVRRLAGHADRMRFVVNKADRLTDTQRDLIAGDLRGRLARDGIADPAVHVVSAIAGDGMDELRATLARAADAKAVLAAKRAADLRATLAALAAAAGIDPAHAAAPLLSTERLSTATSEAVAGALAVVDPDGLARQVRAAVMAGARRSGGSLLGRSVALLAWLTGQQRRAADPVAYLRDWRRRGTLGRVLNPVRGALVEAAAGVPPHARPGLLAALGADAVDGSVSAALDSAAAAAVADLRIPRSWAWPMVGAVQLAIGAVFIFAVAWYVTLFVAGGAVPVATVDAPLVGPVPMPLALLVASIVASAVLGWLMGIHAGWLGRRLAARVRHRTEVAVRDAVTDSGFGGLRRVEGARGVIAAAAAAGQDDGAASVE